ncbi:endonuclease MutS2 [Vallitalea longa]|uniref:Endonuclease MutS2 n=1 Tax=Vallitalea longa TaxID=2936439 RepID=A0A9W6DF92_9FIRM|nr:hypothetical protein [Vallitalea longa]GKX29237.1 endonuclease MutS2 [Vallitalea longa]
MNIDNKMKQEIGLNYILNELAIITPYGIDMKRKLKVFKRNEKKLLVDELDNVECIIESLKKNQCLYSDIERTMMEFKDISNLIKRYNENYILDEVELYEIKNFAINIQKLISIYKALSLDIDVKFYSLKNIVELLNPVGKVTKSFYIYDAYSKELSDIRNKKTNIEKLIFKEIDEEKNRVLKNKRLDLVVMEEKIQRKIQKRLSQKIYLCIKDINKNIVALGKLDMLIAKGKIAIKYCAVKPELDDKINILFHEMKNPKIINYLEKDNKKYIPVSIELKQGVTVITGANMGGKSVTIKTIVLNLILAQMGFYVFAVKASFSMMDFIYLVSDDMQSISRGLSSFGAEIIKINEAVEDIKKSNGFIGLDEFARVTNPREGFILLKALCKFLKDYNTISLVSTHYDGIIDKDIKHYQVVGLKNVDDNILKRHISIDKEDSISIIQEKMDYRLEIVDEKCTVPKDALKVAKMMGLDEKIIEYTESG